MKADYAIPGTSESVPASARSLEDAVNHGRWTIFQKMAAALAIMAVVLDGFDIQLVGVAIPALMEAWDLPREAFVTVLGLGIVAMSIGTFVSGWLGDRIGRKLTLIVSMVIFGFGTLMTVLADGMGLFTASRLIASLGLGGAMPCAVALLSEFTPLRHRSFMVTFGMICTPVGGVLAGIAASSLLPTQGWPALFLVGGVLPLALALVVAVVLPESPQFLATRPNRRAQLEVLVRRLGLPDNVDLDRADASEGREEGNAGYGALLVPGERIVTALLWLQFLGVLTVAFTMFNWLPSYGVSKGFDMATGGAMLAAFNFGGMAGALIGALLIDRLGSRGLTTVFAFGGALSGLSLMAVFTLSPGLAFVLAVIFVAGLFIAGLQPMLFAVAANAYSTRLRSTGVGAALAFGRLGAIASSFIGAVLIAAGTVAFFVFVAAMMVIVALALIAMPRHVKGRGSIQTGGEIA